jgi:hypothetical protein
MTDLISRANHLQTSEVDNFPQAAPEVYGSAAVPHYNRQRQGASNLSDMGRTI